jgi:hypothetical protein
MRPLVTGADTHFESFTGLDSADPVLSEEAAMEKGVAGTIGEFDEAKPLLGVEPFHDTPDRWT